MAHHLPSPDTSANIQLRSVRSAKSPLNLGRRFQPEIIELCVRWYLRSVAGVAVVGQ
jgi:hypothetical protein